MVKTPAGKAFVQPSIPADSNLLMPRSAQRAELAHKERAASKLRVFMASVNRVARFAGILKAKEQNKRVLPAPCRQRVASTMVLRANT